MGLILREHQWVYEKTGGRIGHRLLGVPCLLLRTTGRRSGQTRTAALVYAKDDGRYAVVASNAASERVPAWCLNLRERPEAEATVGEGWRPVRAREASTGERDELWPAFVDMYRGYDHYKEIATRDMPVLVLEPRS